MSSNLLIKCLMVTLFSHNSNSSGQRIKKTKKSDFIPKIDKGPINFIYSITFRNLSKKKKIVVVLYYFLKFVLTVLPMLTSLKLNSFFESNAKDNVSPLSVVKQFTFIICACLLPSMIDFCDFLTPLSFLYSQYEMVENIREYFINLSFNKKYSFYSRDQIMELNSIINEIPEAVVTLADDMSIQYVKVMSLIFTCFIKFLTACSFFQENFSFSSSASGDHFIPALIIFIIMFGAYKMKIKPKYLTPLSLKVSASNAEGRAKMGHVLDAAQLTIMNCKGKDEAALLIDLWADMKEYNKSYEKREKLLLFGIKLIPALLTIGTLIWCYNRHSGDKINEQIIKDFESIYNAIFVMRTVGEEMARIISISNKTNISFNAIRKAFEFAEKDVIKSQQLPKIGKGEGRVEIRIQNFTEEDFKK